MTAGDYSNDHTISILSDPGNDWQFGQGETFDSFIISEYGNFGEPVKGTFGGTMTNYATQPPATVTVSGTFDIIR